MIFLDLFGNSTPQRTFQSPIGYLREGDITENLIDVTDIHFRQFFRVELNARSLVQVKYIPEQVSIEP